MSIKILIFLRMTMYVMLCWEITDTVWRKFLTRKNSNKIYEFLVIHQNFPYQIFLLAIVNVALATVLSIFDSSKFSRCQFSLVKKLYHTV